MSLAKVGNPMRNEPLRTSQALCRFKEDEAELLTHCFLKCFKSLELHSLTHHTDLEKNELFEYASAISGTIINSWKPVPTLPVISTPSRIILTSSRATFAWP